MTKMPFAKIHKTFRSWQKQSAVPTIIVFDHSSNKCIWQIQNLSYKDIIYCSFLLLFFISAYFYYPYYSLIWFDIQYVWQNWNRLLSSYIFIEYGKLKCVIGMDASSHIFKTAQHVFFDLDILMNDI